MADQKNNQHVLRDKTDEAEVQEDLPSYEAIPSSSSQAQPSTSARAPPVQGEKGPSVESPFNFPTDVPAPAYTESAKPLQRPIAIPQLSADPTAPFLQAYAPSLLAQGIPPGTWAAFVDTLSAFLAAKVTDRAVSHAADIAKELGKAPTLLGKNIAAHAKEVGRNIRQNAKRGNIVGAAFGVIAGAISLPIATAVGAVGTVMSLPGTTANAVSQKPQTPRQRAVVYITVANRDWFGPRNLHAQLLDTSELAGLLGVSSNQILENALAGKSADAATQLRSLETHLSELDLSLPTSSTLRIGERTLWLVVMQSHEKI